MIHYDRLILQINKDGQIFSLVHNNEYRKLEGEDCPFIIYRDGTRNQNDWEVIKEKVYNTRQFVRLVNNYKKIRLSLGDILNELHLIKSNKPVLFRTLRGLCGVGNNTLSYRGNYFDLAISTTHIEKASTKNKLIQLLEESLRNKSMTGYKGGNFEINKEIDVAIADYGSYGSYIIGIIERDNHIEFIMEDIK